MYFDTAKSTNCLPLGKINPNTTRQEINFDFRVRLETAINIYRLTGSHQHELARALFLLNKLLRRVNMEDLARSYQEEAMRLQRLLVPEVSSSSLTSQDEDFENLVVVLKR